MSETVTPPLTTSSLRLTGPEHAKGKGGKIRLTTGDKVHLLKPLFLRYMLALCAVYVEEYLINSVSQDMAAHQ